MRPLIAAAAALITLFVLGCTSATPQRQPQAQATGESLQPHQYQHKPPSPHSRRADTRDQHVDHAHDQQHARTHQHPTHDPQSPCICEQKQSRDIWCPKCNVGYLATRRINSAMLFDTLDPHGHEINLNTLTCNNCQTAVRNDGFCNDCGMGFVNKKAYFTQLTHGLAKGRRVPPQTINCQTCRANRKSTGWCSQCQRGLIGNIAFNDQTLFEQTAEQWRLLDQAQAKVDTCELCACAMMVHRTCPECQISYKQAPVESDSTHRRDGVSRN